MNGISVVICCYNSAKRLPLALSYLAKQKTNAKFNWDIILVDNNSTDDTANIAKQIWHEHSDNNMMTVINENNAGLSYAREAGVKAAKHDVIVFCDDDNLLEDNYLQYGYDLVNKTIKQGYGIWGGEPVAYFEDNTPIPDWFEKAKSNYVIGKQDDKTGDISYRGYVWGAGMIILKHIYLTIVNDKFPLFLKDRTKTALTSGGDAEICLRALIIGYRLYYDSNLVLKHYIPGNRLTPQYNAALIKGFKSSNNVINKYKIFIHYIASKSYSLRIYYVLIYKLKHFLATLKLRPLTDYDYNVLSALYKNDKFYDPDFDLMRRLFQMKVIYNVKG